MKTEDDYIAEELKAEHEEEERKIKEMYPDEIDWKAQSIKMGAMLTEAWCERDYWKKEHDKLSEECERLESLLNVKPGEDIEPEERIVFGVKL